MQNFDPFCLFGSFYWQGHWHDFFTIMNDRFLQALHGSNLSGPPIWFMRQAGRHLSTYRELRKRYPFLQMCHEPDLITEVTLLPIEAYDVDAAILFSDILVIPEAMGVGLRFEENIGPIIERPIEDRNQIEALPLPDMSKLQYVAKGIWQLKRQLKVPLIGFCGAPFTVASYMIEGRGSHDLKKTKKWLLKDPESFHLLLHKITAWTQAYLMMQIASGVNALQIFDSWANSLAHHQFREFSLNYLKILLEGMYESKIPTILFCRGSSVFAPQLAELKPAGIGLDWNCQMRTMRKKIPCPIALQGNLDPFILYAPISKIEEEAQRLLNEMEGDPGFIFNLGHGIAPDTAEESVRSLVACVKEKRKCHLISSS